MSAREPKAANAPIPVSKTKKTDKYSESCLKAVDGSGYQLWLRNNHRREGKSRSSGYNGRYGAHWFVKPAWLERPGHRTRRVMVKLPLVETVRRIAAEKTAESRRVLQEHRVAQLQYAKAAASKELECANRVYPGKYHGFSRFDSERGETITYLTMPYRGLIDLSLLGGDPEELKARGLWLDERIQAQHLLWCIWPESPAHADKRAQSAMAACIEILYRGACAQGIYNKGNKRWYGNDFKAENTIIDLELGRGHIKKIRASLVDFEGGITSCMLPPALLKAESEDAALCQRTHARAIDSHCMGLLLLELLGPEFSDFKRTYLNDDKRSQHWVWEYTVKRPAQAFLYVSDAVYAKLMHYLTVIETQLLVREKADLSVTAEGIKRRPNLRFVRKALENHKAEVILEAASVKTEEVTIQLTPSPVPTVSPDAVSMADDVEETKEEAVLEPTETVPPPPAGGAGMSSNKQLLWGGSSQKGAANSATHVRGSRYTG